MAVLNQILLFSIIFSVKIYNTSGMCNLFDQYNLPSIGEITEADAQLPVWKTMQQYVDNFDPQNTAMWEMRYIENGQFYKSGGPIFIFLGGVVELDIYFVMRGPMHRMAKEHHGMMYFPEHRYYGESIPTPDCSLKNLKYLSADQALEDLARFIAARKEELFEKNNETDQCQNKVVVMGADYGGSLATWARIKYPHLVHAAWASSACLRAGGDFYEFYEVVGESISLVNQTCLNIVEDAIAQIEKLLETPSGQEIIKNVFRFNGNFNDPQERSRFFVSIAGYFSDSLIIAGTLFGLNYDCMYLLAEKGKSYEKLAHLVRQERARSFGSGYEKVIDSKSGWDCSRDLSRAYQRCTEFGFFPTSNSTKQPFGKNFMLDYFVEKLCIEKFGKNFNVSALAKDTYRTNLVYGSTKPDVTRVVSIYGSINPCRSLGVVEDLNEEAPAIVMQGISDSLDIYSAKDQGDFREVINAQNKARNIISKWLQ